MFYFGIIGSVEDMSSDMFQKMKQIVLQILERLRLPLEEIVLVSGGSPFMDHVAVSLFLDHPKQFQGLQLFLPCNYRIANEKLVFLNNRAQFYNCGKILRSSHAKFQRQCHISSCQDLAKALALGATTRVHLDGFYARNAQLAMQCEYLVVGTFDSRLPKNKGLLKTWCKCPNLKIHIPLHLLNTLEQVSIRKKQCVLQQLSLLHSDNDTLSSSM